MLISRAIAFFSVLMFLVWPSSILFAFLAQSIANGFVDPALHVASFKRNPQPLYKKAIFSLGKLLHHGGGILTAGEMMRPLGLSITAANSITIYDLPWPVAVIMFCEFVHWTEDLMVLQRNAPKWLRWMGLPIAAIQTTALVVQLLFSVDPLGGTSYLNTFTAATVLGNSIDFVANVVGNKVSTYEIEVQHVPVKQRMQRFIAGAFKGTTEHLPVQNAKSVARLQHKTFVETTVRGSMDLDSGDDSPRRCGKSGGSEAAIV